MKQILLIFRKDLRETLRDKRTLIVMVIVPLLLFPAILGITTKMQVDSAKEQAMRHLRVGLVSDGADMGLGALLNSTPLMEAVPMTDTALVRTWVREGRLELGVALENGFADKMDAMGTGKVITFGAATDDIAMDRLGMVLEGFEQRLLRKRLDSLHLQQSAIDPLMVESRDTALKKETIGKLIGGFLPYIFIIFCYMGSMFPAIDLFTGEKERGTIETLLSAPVARWKILVGKMMVIVLAGISTALLSLTGLFLSLQLVADIPAELLNVALEILTPGFILSLIGMLLPLVIFFAGIMIPATVYAKSFKEASSILSPMNFLIITPAVIGMMPGIELNAITALIPVLNVVLSTKELIAGTMNWGYFAMVLSSLIALAAGAVLFSFKRFGNERNVLRG